MESNSKKITIEELATFSKKKGFVFQAAEIYGGLGGFFDFGPLGVELKNNIKNLYWTEFVRKREDMSGQDGSIITNPKVWKASGHTESFGDLILITKETKTRIRADHFIEDELNIPADGMPPEEIMKLIEEHNLTYKGEGFQDIQNFNIMFNTQVGANPDTSNTSYLRPETCQSIFPNFRLIADTQRLQLPFGICQVGKAFRNEISPRDFVFRSREFEQIEMEYFFNPEVEFKNLTEEHLETKFQFLSAESQDNGNNGMIETNIQDLLDKNKLNKVHAYWLATFFNFYKDKVGLSYENLRIREHVKTELSHYSAGTMDIDYKFPHGFKEMVGMANRTNFDLKQHQEHSKSKLEIFDNTTNTKIIPHCIEPSVGVERLFLAVLNEAYNDDKERGNTVLNFPAKLAPYKVAIFPLMNKPELVKLAREIYDELIDEEIDVIYDKSGSIGKRYARQDEVGTPYCLTIDYEAIEDGEHQGTVTIRDRDSTEQKRINIKEISAYIKLMVRGDLEFKNI